MCISLQWISKLYFAKEKNTKFALFSVDTTVKTLYGVRNVPVTDLRDYRESTHAHFIARTLLLVHKHNNFKCCTVDINWRNKQSNDLSKVDVV